MKLDIGAPPGGAPKSLRERIASVRAQVAVAAEAAGRDPGAIAVLGVAKKQPYGVVREAVEAGLRDIGESYVQEARDKYMLYPPLDARKHFIGHVQMNKAAAVAQMFDVVHSVDRFELGLAIGKAARVLGKPITMLVQVNISSTERHGVAPDGAAALAERLRAEGFDVGGVMAIGPLTDDRTHISSAFACAAAVFERVGGSTLSLGMSGDFREAIAYGSTLVRIGTALFGARA
jgi:hypothetical protein